MKRLIFVCEGPTENEFCQDVLMPHFLTLGISCDAPLIKHSGGGIVAWPILKSQIIKHLYEADAYVTTFVDYYGIKESHQFPGWATHLGIVGGLNKVRHLERAMLGDIPQNLRHRFIPHLQLHEFESLLFSNVKVFPQNFSDAELKYHDLESAVQQYPNPEDINNSPITAPSKRLIDAVTGYEKVLFGNCLAMDIGLPTMRAKCPHFNDWISRLEQI